MYRITMIESTRIFRLGAFTLCKMMCFIVFLCQLVQFVIKWIWKIYKIHSGVITQLSNAILRDKKIYKAAKWLKCVC